ncbi:hypothetical protein ABPG77_001830 [Micractinium sp. CCAP 211/92]
MARHRRLLLAVLIPFALAWTAQGAGLARERLPRLGRALLQPTTQIPQECSNGFSQAYAFCADVTAQTPGSLCCSSLQQLGSACLLAVQASLSSSSGTVSALQRLTAALSSCQISLDGSAPPASPASPASLPSPPGSPSMPAPPASNDSCPSGFSAALSACGGSGSACCDPVRALGDACLAQLAASSDVFASVTFGLISQTCGLNVTAGGDEQLPGGTILVSFTALGKDGAACSVWYDSAFHPGTEPKWNATGRDMPSDAEILSVAERWCENRDTAVAEMFQALDAGGRTAQVAVAAYTLYKCPSDNKDLWDIMDLINSEQLNDPNTTVKYAQAIVEAANETGLNFCIPVVVLSNLTGSVLFYKDYHTGPQADEPDGCLPNFQQAQVICSNDTAPPAQPCCDAVDALGATCRATIAASADSLVSSAYASIAGSCGTFADAPAPSPSGGGVPSGNISLAYAYGPTAQCSSFDASTQNFTTDTNSTWAAASNDAVSPSDVQAFASQMCSLAENAGPLLVQALTAGGDQAKVAAYALTRKGICTNDTAQGAALDALINAILSSDSETMFSLINSLIEAADHTGVGFCVSVVITDPQTGAVILSADNHTSVAAPGSAPVLSRRLAGLGSGAMRGALGRGRLRSALLGRTTLQR